MRIAGAILIAALSFLSVGCGSSDKVGSATAGATKTAPGGRVFLTVDFQPGQTLRYKFTSKKKITLDWDPNAAADSSHVQEQAEDFEMIVAYTPVEVAPYGSSTIRAVVESVQAVRSGGPASRNFGPDAVQAAQGESFMIKVDPRGKLVDATELSALIQELGKRAFRGETSGGRIKEPDMIWDFIASQWFLWDAEATVERPAEGVALGQTWRSQLCVPTPMVMRLARNVVYKLAEVHQDVAQPPSAGDATGPLAVIQSTYTLADAVPAGWPIPYAGRFQVSGTFGFLAFYQALGLEGTGEERFNMKTGRIEQRRETYTLRTKAGLPPLGIKANPHVTIEQTLTMELVNRE